MHPEDAAGMRVAGGEGDGHRARAPVAVVSVNPSRVVRCVADTANDATAQTRRSR